MFRLRASDVASAAGFNPYKSVREVVLDNIERLSKSSKQVERERFTTTLEQSRNIIETIGNEEQKEQIKTVEKETKKQLTVAKIQKTKKINVLEKTRKCIYETDMNGEEKLAKMKEIDQLKKEVEDIYVEKVEKVNEEINTATSTLNQEIIQKTMETAITEKSVGGSKLAEESVINKLDDKLDPATMAQVKELATRHVNTNRGINEEESIINKHAQDTGTIITKRNTEFYTLFIDDIKVVGAIDGYSEEEGLIEVKNRRNRFLGMPRYEMIQCEVYMRMLGIDHCTHIERFNGKDRDTSYDLNHFVWDEVLEGLERYKKLFKQINV